MINVIFWEKEWLRLYGNSNGWYSPEVKAREKEERQAACKGHWPGPKPAAPA